MPGKVCEIDASATLSSIVETSRYDWLYILVRFKGEPVGWVSLSNARRDPMINERVLSEAILDQLGWPLAVKALNHRLAAQADTRAPLPPISLVICTRDRPNLLSECLKTVLALDYPAYEVVVVDNAPSTSATETLAASLPVRYVREDLPGLDWARNRGIKEARHEIVAFTDDDVRVDRYWLKAIAGAFSDPDVRAVTGLIAPAELESNAQHLFEFKYGGMGKGFSRRRYNKRDLTAQSLLSAHSFGVGANMAFRRSVFDDVGPFDIALDVGTPTGGGGDLDMFHRIVAGGHTLAYEPSALVWHVHRRSIALLRQQIFDNGRSFGSYLITCARNRTVRTADVVQYIIRRWIGGWILPRLITGRGFPRRLSLAELFGALKCIGAYWASRRLAARLNANAGSRRQTAQLSG